LVRALRSAAASYLVAAGRQSCTQTVIPSALSGAPFATEPSSAA
jgi:hypothetical protein